MEVKLNYHDFTKGYIFRRKSFLPKTGYQRRYPRYLVECPGLFHNPIGVTQLSNQNLEKRREIKKWLSRNLRANIGEERRYEYGRSRYREGVYFYQKDDMTLFLMTWGEI